MESEKVTALKNTYAVCYSNNSKISIHCCDFANETWNCVATKTQKDTICSVVAVKEKIYIFLKRAIQIFDSKTLVWELLESGYDVIDGSTLLPYGNAIYCFDSCDRKFMGKVRCYDTDRNKWIEKGNMKTPRCGSAAVSLGEFIYVTGGADTTPLSVVEKYDPSTSEWTTIAPMLSARCWHCCVVMNGKIYACGGSTDSDDHCKAEIYDPLTNNWNYISSMTIKRCYFSLVAHNLKLYAFGGKNKSGLPRELEMYDSENDQWKTGFSVPDGFRFAVSMSVAPH